MKEDQLNELLKNLTLEEKVYQLVQLSGDFYSDDAVAVGPKTELGITQKVVDNAGSVLNVIGAEKIIKTQKKYLEKSRHKIPLLFMADIIYGYKTIFPIPLALGCTWNPELIRNCNTKVVAKEASASGAHVTFAPMVDLVRDPRWGRVMESTGEDTYLNSLFSSAMVKGFQGNFEPDNSIASCVKHFAAYGAPEAGREYNTVDMSERRLRQDYLPSYKAAVDSGCELVMTSFNTIDGIPATGNKWLLKDVLRNEWGFNGVIITDYAAIQELIAHGVARNDSEAAKLSIEASVDIDMKTPCYSNNLKQLVESGAIKENLIDECCMRVLKLKNKLGLFENPYRGASIKKEKEVLCCREHRTLARKVAAESLVLLQNNNNVLPISKKSKKVALIGPYGDSTSIIGLWAIHGDKADVITLKTAIEEKFDALNFTYAKGCDLLDDYSFLGDFGKVVNKGNSQNTNNKQELENALSIASEADVVILALGEHKMQSGEAGSRTNITIPKIQLDLLDKIKELGKETVLVLFGGRPLILTDVINKVDAIIEAWFPGTEGGHAIADILFGDVNPSGRLTMSFPYAVGQIPVYYNQFNTGRPAKTSTHSDRFTSKFLDCPNEPLFPFGYGLSYTTYEYSNLEISSNTLKDGEKLKVSVTVTNTGEYAGTETVQMYIRDLIGSVVRPVKELRGFQKIELNPGESRQICFSIEEKQLAFFTKDMKYEAEKGEFMVFIGHDSINTLETKFTKIQSNNASSH